MTAASTVTDEPVELTVGGMSCAACAARIEKRLNLLDGVAATVNYATERAYVASTGGRAVSELISAIEAAGYTAAVPGPATSEVDPAAAAASRLLAWRLAACAPLAICLPMERKSCTTTLNGHSGGKSAS